MLADCFPIEFNSGRRETPRPDGSRIVFIPGKPNRWLAINAMGVRIGGYYSSESLAQSALNDQIVAESPKRSGCANQLNTYQARLPPGTTRQRLDGDPPDIALAKAISLHDDEIHGPMSAEELAEMRAAGPDGEDDDDPDAPDPWDSWLPDVRQSAADVSTTPVSLTPIKAQQIIRREQRLRFTRDERAAELREAVRVLRALADVGEGLIGEVGR